MPKVPLREEGTALQIGLGRRELEPLPRVRARTDFRAKDFDAEAGRELQVVGYTLQDISGAVNRADVFMRRLTLAEALAAARAIEPVS